MSHKTVIRMVRVFFVSVLIGALATVIFRDWLIDHSAIFAEGYLQPVARLEVPRAAPGVFQVGSFPINPAAWRVELVLRTPDVARLMTARRSEFDVQLKLASRITQLYSGKLKLADITIVDEYRAHARVRIHPIDGDILPQERLESEDLLAGCDVYARIYSN